MTHDLTVRVKTTAKAAGADLVGVASIDRFDYASHDVHPRSIFSHTQSVIAVGCRMVRGALKAAEEGHYWQAYNCDSYQYLNEVLAPHLLRRIVLLLEDQGYTAVPIHNPFCAHVGRPVYPGGPHPDSIISLRVVGCAAGLGELGLSKLFLTPQFGPRQRMYAVLTDAVLEPDPLFTLRSVLRSTRGGIHATRRFSGRTRAAITPRPTTDSSIAGFATARSASGAGACGPVSITWRKPGASRGSTGCL
jgi:epoxyqueuosine reductase QueG